MDKVLLERMYVRQGRSIAEVARMLGISEKRVSDSLNAHEIARHGVAQSSTFLPPGRVVSLYTDRHWSIRRIAEYFGVGRLRVRELLEEHEIPIRDRMPELIQPRRTVARVEDAVVHVTMTGKKITKRVVILSCGHKRNPGRVVPDDLTDVTYGCPICPKEERS